MPHVYASPLHIPLRQSELLRFAFAFPVFISFISLLHTPLSTVLCVALLKPISHLLYLEYRQHSAVRCVNWLPGNRWQLDIGGVIHDVSLHTSSRCFRYLVLLVFESGDGRRQRVYLFHSVCSASHRRQLRVLNRMYFHAAIATVKN